MTEHLLDIFRHTSQLQLGIAAAAALLIYIYSILLYVGESAKSVSDSGG